MRLRKVKGAMDKVNESTYTIVDPEQYKNNFNSVFGNDNEIHLEIGTGKGDFLIGMAQAFPDINFIGIEKYESVLVRMVEKLNELELKNIKVIRYDAMDIENLFNHEITTLYLNFSDPWPKVRHAKRRLTSEVFLAKYDHIFKGIPHIIQKTDNIGLYAYSICSLSKYGYTINEASLDLHSEDKFNVETEYEHKFSSKGVKINFLDATKE